MVQASNPKHSLYTQSKSTEKKTEHLVVAIVEDKPGVFSRIAGLFRRRNFNIKSITIGNCEQKGLSRMTIVVDGTKTITEQLVKQLYKIIEVIKVIDLPEDQSIVRELALIKITTTKQTRSEIMQIVDISGAKIVGVNLDSVMVELTGDHQKIDSFLEMVKVFGIRELARTGVTAMQKGMKES